MTKALTLLLLAVGAEIFATFNLKLSFGFTKVLPSIFVILGYSTAFYLLAQSLKIGMPIGIAYAIWSGLGTAIIAILGWFFLHEAFSWKQVVGIIMVIGGVIILNLASNTGD